MTEPSPPPDENIVRSRNGKKFKGRDQSFSNPLSLPVNYVDIHNEKGTKSYRDSILGQPGETEANVQPESIVVEDEIDGETRWKVEDKEWGDYTYSVFSLSEHEEEVRIQRKWKQGLIVKLLGRKIGFMALENRLNQLWGRMGLLMNLS